MGYFLLEGSDVTHTETNNMSWVDVVPPTDGAGQRNVIIVQQGVRGNGLSKIELYLDNAFHASITVPISTLGLAAGIDVTAGTTPSITKSANGLNLQVVIDETQAANLKIVVSLHGNYDFDYIEIGGDAPAAMGLVSGSGKATVDVPFVWVP